jgi:D-galactarolactone cycloisomerase
MTRPNRRSLIAAALAAPGFSTAALARSAGPVHITAIDTFDIQVPGAAGAPPSYRGLTPGRNNVLQVTTDAGVRGFSFLGTGSEEVAAAAPRLTGANLFAVEAHLKNGLLDWPAVEEAMWDAIGKLAGQPLCRLMGGGALQTLPVYFTYVWGGKEDDVSPKAQAAQAARLRAVGFRAMKIQAMRSDYRGDAEAVREMLAAGGPGFRVMVDRTAGAVGLWSYDQALTAARALQEAGCYWLEEPLARDDLDGPARLCRELDMLVTGGEGWKGLEEFRKGLEHRTYDIMQPEMRQCAGPLTMRKIGALCQAFGVPIAPHAATGLALAGRLQISAAMGSVYQEIGTLAPDTFASDVWAPYAAIFDGEQPFTFRDGEIAVPQYPGLGLNVDEGALAKFRVTGFETRGVNPQAKR